MPTPQDFLEACHSTTWQEARNLLPGDHLEEATRSAAWHAVAIMAPPAEVHELFHSGQAPERPYLIWQNRYDKHAAQALKRQSDEAAKEHNLDSEATMLAVLQDPAEQTDRRLAAIQALSQLRSRSAILPLISAMREEPLANACAHALIQIGSRRHLRRLVQSLTASTPGFLKQEAIYCLWMLRDRRGAASLARIALDRARESDRTRLMAAEALGNNVRKPFIQRILAHAMLDPCLDVRKSALFALGRLHDRPMLRVLRQATESRLQDPEVICDSTFGEQVRETLECFDAASGPRRLGRYR